MAGLFQLSNEDAVEWLAGFAADSVPLIVLDPGVPGRAPRRARGDPAIPAFAEARLPALLYEVHRVLAPGRLCWWLTESAHAFKAAHVASRMGFALGSPLVWDRGDGPGARVAFALPLSRERARSPGAELISAHRLPDAPNRLPALLCEALVLASSEPGEVVVDPFMGSAAIGASALIHGRNYLGNDRAAIIGDALKLLAKLGSDALTAAPINVDSAELASMDACSVNAWVTGRTAATGAAVASGTAGQLTIF